METDKCPNCHDETLLQIYNQDAKFCFHCGFVFTSEVKHTKEDNMGTKNRCPNCDTGELSGVINSDARICNKCGFVLTGRDVHMGYESLKDQRRSVTSTREDRGKGNYYNDC